MFMRNLQRSMAAAAVLVASTVANAAPVLQSVSPLAVTYTYGSGNDFTVPSGTGSGDVTAAVYAVDLLLPSPGGSTSGCEAADFAGFAAGSIALIQRGTCSFDIKAANAQAAGAAAVLLFNEGDQPSRTDAIGITLGAFQATVPVFFASYGVGSLFANGLTSGATGFTAHMAVDRADVAVPEPGTVALLGLGLAALAATARRRRLG